MRFAHLSILFTLTCLSHLSADEKEKRQPNILFILVDELRKPVVYESEDLQKWSRENLKAMSFLQDNGVTFDNHYCASTACAPSRTSLFTGQYPTFHGVSQTDGAAKPASDPTMFWLPPYSVPTAGNIFTEGYYRTFYIGKWHISKDDLIVPGTQNAVLSYNGRTGVRDPHLENVYRTANLLSPYGFSNGWVGPEPHGAPPHQSGASAAIGVSGRDVFYADDTISLLKQLETENPAENAPWFIVCSFVNPHDITLYGDTTKKIPTYNFKIDSSLPDVPPAPTADEDLSTKPLAQASYKEQYQKAFQPTTDTEEYRKLYYTLQKKVDNEIGRVLKALEDSSFLENTIIVFTSDHGDLLGAHGNFQKWFNMYEEAVHVPLTFYSKTLLPHPKHIDILTSHVDLLPTLCGLADIDPVAITTKLQETFTNSQNLVGRDLSKVIKEPMKPSEIKELEEPILFLTYDQILTGSTTQSAVNTPYQYVEQPAFINAVISKEEGNEIWKLAMYFEDQTFSGAPLPCTCSTPIDSPNFPNMVQFEMYNLSSDPLETQNLADEAYATPKTRLIQRKLYKALKKQLAEKALVPSN